MRGHMPLIAMRRKGAMPDMVWVETDRDDAVRQWHHWPVDTPHIAHIEIDRDDPVHRMDLRCLVGMRCTVVGQDSGRVQQVVRACIDAGAARVIAAHTTVSINRGEPTATTHWLIDTALEGAWPI